MKKVSCNVETLQSFKSFLLIKCQILYGLALLAVGISVPVYFSSLILTMYVYVQDKLCIESHGLLYTFKSLCRMLVGKREKAEAEV